MRYIQLVAAPTPDELGWQRATLFSSSGIRGQEEQERRACSALLAVMTAVPAFGRALMSHVGAPGGSIAAYAEVMLRTTSGPKCRPDGAIWIRRGQTDWRCLVEVKTSRDALDVGQLSTYFDAARANGATAILSVSNDITPTSRDLPYEVDRRRVRGLTVRHLSWWQVLTIAIVLRRHKGITDPEQAFILEELIRYLSHPNSGATGLRDMGRSWVAVRDGTRAGTLRPGDEDTLSVVARWDQFMSFLALALTQELGAAVHPVRPGRAGQDASRTLAEKGELIGALRIPRAAGDVVVSVDLRAATVSASVSLDAPDKMRALPRINWLVRQLKDADPRLRLDVAFPNTAETTAALLAEAREQGRGLLHPRDPKRAPKSFRITATQPMARGRGRESGSFIDATRNHVLSFYRDLVQQLRPWQPSPPQVRDAGPVVDQAVAEALRTDGETDRALVPVLDDSSWLTSSAAKEPSDDPEVG
jgi:hypothetical protein